MIKNWLKLELRRDLPRTTTREEYKVIMHWLRFCRWQVMKTVDLYAIRRKISDMLIYGVNGD